MAALGRHAMPSLSPFGRCTFGQCSFRHCSFRHCSFRHCAAIALALAASALVGCKPDRPRELLPTPLRLSPVDSASEGELNSGKETAFGFVLPHGMRVTARMGDAVYAEGRVGFEAAKRYLRDQVSDADASETPTQLVLDNAKLSHRPKDKVRLVLTYDGSQVELVIRDRRRKPAEAGLTEAQRWKRAGLTPTGQVIENDAQ